MNQLEKYIYEAIAVLPHYHENKGENEVDLGAGTKEVISYINENINKNIDENSIKAIINNSTLFSSSEDFGYLSFTKPIYFKYRNLSNGAFLLIY